MDGLVVKEALVFIIVMDLNIFPGIPLFLGNLGVLIVILILMQLKNVHS